MAKILVQGEWYEEVPYRSLYEEDFERLVIQEVPHLYPYHHTVPFKIGVQSETSTAQADLALIEKEYREWWVVEVEMGYHSLNTHVVPQVRTLADAIYGPDAARYLCQHSSALEIDSVLDMMKGSQPKVLIVVNRIVPEWMTALAPFNAKVLMVEVFRSSRNHHIFRVTGDELEKLGDLVSKCRVHPQLSNVVQIDAPAGLGIKHLSHVTIQYEGSLTRWERIDGVDTAWLIPTQIGKSPLATKVEYGIYRQEDGSLEFREISH